MSAIETQWSTVLDEYENSQNWFKDLIYSQLQTVERGITTPDLKHFMRNPDFGSSESMLQAYGGMFSPFYTSEWDMIDETFETEEAQSIDSLNLIKSQRAETVQFEDKVFTEEKDRKIEKASEDLDKELNEIDMQKNKLRNAAINSLSELDTLVSRTGLISGEYKRKRQIAENSVTANTQQANLNRMFAINKAEKDTIAAEKDYENKINKSQLRFDAAYDTEFQNVKQKSETANINLMLDKIDIYNAWKAGQINQLAKLTSQQLYIPKPEVEDTTNPQVVNEHFDTVFQDCISSGGTTMDCNEFAADMYDYTSVLPDTTYNDPNQQGDLISTIVDSVCDVLPDWVC